MSEFHLLLTEDAMEFNARIDQAVKMYDHLLQERLNSTYRQRMGANAYGNPGLQQQQQYHAGGETAPSFAPLGNQAYPHLPEPEPQYGAFAPTMQQPYEPPQQHYAPYVPEQGYATAPFASAPPGSAGVFTEHYQAPVSVPGSIPVSSASVSSPAAQQVGQFPGYAPMTAHAPGFSSGLDQPATMMAYAPYNDHYQQQPHQLQNQLPHQLQQQPQSAPAPPVEEKPLIEF